MTAPARTHSPYCGCVECAPPAPTVLRPTRVVFRTTQAAELEDGTMEPIIEAVAAEFRLPPTSLRGPSRMKALVEARQLATYVARQLTRLSYPEIGRALRRDHSTAMASVTAMARKLEKDAGLKAAAERVIERLKAREKR